MVISDHIPPRDSNAGVILKFLRHSQGRSNHMWSDGIVLESYREKIGRWESSRPNVLTVYPLGTSRMKERPRNMNHKLFQELKAIEYGGSLN